MEEGDYQNLLHSTYSSLEKYSLNGLVTLGKVVKVYDGDSVHVAFPINNKLVRVMVRLLGIDTAELRTKNKKEKKCAILAKNFVKKKLQQTNYICTVEFYEDGKYGRPLASLYNKYIKKDDKYYPCITDVHKSINQQLLDCGLALEYEGGKKVQWSSLENKMNSLISDERDKEEKKKK